MLPPCVGRAETLSRVQSLLGAARWLTLVGPPGCGKSLLARHAVAGRDSVVWVDAQQLGSVDTLLAGCLDALGAEIAPGESQLLALQNALDGTATILVLDGVDDIDGHLSGLGRLLQNLVELTTSGTILTTAVTLAGHPSEQVVRVGPLPVPGPSSTLEGPAVELLLSRIASAGGRAVDLEAHGDLVRDLLVSSGGLPLLIEQLAVQIALVGLTDVSPAETLSEAVLRSYQLLDEDQQRCFRRLAVMDSPVSLEVLADITGVSRAEAAGLAAALARRSLVEVGSDGRFGMLAPIRRVGSAAASEGDDRAAAMAGLVRWADRVTPDDFVTGASDAGWLPETTLMRTAILHACADGATRPLGYRLANRIFSSLYTAMRARDAVDILQAVLATGDGPPEVGAQLARRAGIAASEVNGTYAGLALLERSEAFARETANAEQELARVAAIRAEMHLDAGALQLAQEDAERAVKLGAAADDGYVVRQARRTLMDVLVSIGEFAAAETLADLVIDAAPSEEVWMALSARTLLARIAFEQGRTWEATAMARAARDQALAAHEDRVALLAGTLLRLITDGSEGEPADLDNLPWAVRLVVALQDARERLAAGEVEVAAGRAADILVLADSGRLGRDGIDARLLVGDAMVALGDPTQACAAYLSALRRAVACALPLRVADALDGLAHLGAAQGHPAYRSLAGAARVLRRSRGAVPHRRPGLKPVEGTPRDCPPDWVVDGQFTGEGLDAVIEVCQVQPADPVESPLDVLTRAERAVATLVAEGLTSRQIAEQLFVSPRTVDAHLAHIYRKLEIGSRARLAALMSEMG